MENAAELWARQCGDFCGKFDSPCDISFIVTLHSSTQVYRSPHTLFRLLSYTASYF
jgi:hypothetical protein